MVAGRTEHGSQPGSKPSTLPAIDCNMLKIKQRPYNLLLGTAIVLTIASLLNLNYPIYIYGRDEYFFSLTTLRWLPTLLLALLWLIYLSTNRVLFSGTLTWTHIILTILCSIFITIIPYLAQWLRPPLFSPRRYYLYSGIRGFVWAFKQFDNIKKAVIISFSSLIAGTMIYFVNLFTGLYYKQSARPNSR